MCRPFRLQAKKLEPAVWKIISEHLCNPVTAQSILKTAQSLHNEHLKGSEAKRVQEKIRTIEGQIEVLAERLAHLPKMISPAAIYRQMEKFEQAKSQEQTRLSRLLVTEGTRDQAPPLKDFDSYVHALKGLAESGGLAKGKIIRSLVQRIDIEPEGFKLHLMVGKTHLEGELAALNASKKNLLGCGSNSLTNGDHGRD